MQTTITIDTPHAAAPVKQQSGKMPAVLERCRCHPLATLRHQECAVDHNSHFDLIPVSAKLQRPLRRQLKLLLPQTTSLSVLLLHIVQFETLQVTSRASIIPQRLCYHVTDDQVEQIVQQMRRSLRSNDQQLIQEKEGVALILPEVDHIGAQAVLERVYQSLNLLQAQTFVPPLQHETEIKIGIGSYPSPGTSVERLLYYSGLTGKSLTLRPLVHPQDWNTPEPDAPTPLSPATTLQPVSGRVPFMQLPQRLPARLTRLIPCELARRLQCAPVGSEQNNLTVAMAAPADAQAIQTLHTRTAMNIFPVACNPAQLRRLLATGW